MTSDLNIQVLVRGKEVYCFLYPTGKEVECIKTLGRFASDPELAFSWWDAAKVCQSIRNEAKGAMRG